MIFVDEDLTTNPCEECYRKMILTNGEDSTYAYCDNNVYHILNNNDNTYYALDRRCDKKKKYDYIHQGF